MAEFGKLNFAVAFNPQTAFPLDARSYFESYDEAVAAAKTAATAGNKNTVYYFGQTLTVVENNVASFYIIQPDGSLTAVAGQNDEPIQVPVNENQFTYVDNKLTLKGSADATEGQVLSMDASGALAWVTPVDAYTKDETDKKIAAAAHLKRKIVDSVAAIDVNATDAEQYIYMVPNGLTVEDDRYDEYMVITIADTRFVEKVGTWAVDLQDYAKKTDLEEYVEKVDGSRLLTSEEAAKIAESEKNVIAAVDTTQFAISDERVLSLLDIAIGKVSGLQAALDSKVTAITGYTLLSPTQQDKLDALVIGEDGSVGVSGSINASNVKELDSWITTNREKVDGLLSEALQTRLEGLFDTVNPDEFVISDIVDGKKQLDLLKVSISKVDGLNDILDSKASTEALEALEAKFADYVTTESYSTDMANVLEAITWGELSEE